jgi:hypothetical protein
MVYLRLFFHKKDLFILFCLGFALLLQENGEWGEALKSQKQPT